MFEIILEFGGPQVDVRYLSHHTFNLDPVTLTDFSTKNNGKAADHIAGHVLKPEAHTDTDGTGKHQKKPEIEPQDVQCN